MSGPVHDLERLAYSDEDGVEDGAIESDEPALQCEAAVEAQRPPFPEEHARLSEDRPRIIGRLQPPEWVEVWAGGRLAEEGGGRLADEGVWRPLWRAWGQLLILKGPKLGYISQLLDYNFQILGLHDPISRLR